MFWTTKICGAPVQPCSSKFRAEISVMCQKAQDSVLENTSFASISWPIFDKRKFLGVNFQVPTNEHDVWRCLINYAPTIQPCIPGPLMSVALVQDSKCVQSNYAYFWWAPAWELIQNDILNPSKNRMLWAFARWYLETSEGSTWSWEHPATLELRNSMRPDCRMSIGKRKLSPEILVYSPWGVMCRC